MSPEEDSLSRVLLLGSGGTHSRMGLLMPVHGAHVTYYERDSQQHSSVNSASACRSSLPKLCRLALRHL